MDTSYRYLLEQMNLQFADEEIGTVVRSTITLLRRHNIDGTLCPHCGNDDPEGCRVTNIDVLGFITEVIIIIIKLSLFVTQTDITDITDRQYIDKSTRSTQIEFT